MPDDKSLFDRLLAVQKELEVVSKTQENDYFNSKFANINDVLEMILPILNKHEILLLQPLTHVDGKPAIKTILMHGTECMEEVMVLHEDPNPQKMGSGYTYGRRHALISAIGVRTGDDDDGALASGTQKPTAPKKEQPKAQSQQEIQTTKNGWSMHSLNIGIHIRKLGTIIKKSGRRRIENGRS